MKPLTVSPLGSRIASVHNGSSLFTGDAGSGESNIRRYIIENDWLEAIVQLPNNMFHNTGITTYVWVLSNCKAAKRKGKVQLIDASEMYQKLRKNLGAKNCEFSAEHIEQITELYLGMQPSPSAPLPEGGGSKKMISKVFENRDFGYYKVTIERPLRLAAQFTAERVAGLRYVPGLRGVMEWAYGQWGDRIYDELALRKGAMEAYLEEEAIELSKKQRDALFSLKTWETQRSLMGVGERIMEAVEGDVFLDFNGFGERVDTALKVLKMKLSVSERNQILGAVSWRDESAERVVKKVHKFKKPALTDLLVDLDGSVDQLQDFGYWAGSKPGEWVEYESDSELRDTENVPLREEIHGYFEREVRPHVADAWMALDKTQIGYEISFNKYFYQHKPLRGLEEVTAEILQLERETEGLLKRLVSLGGE